MPSKIIRFAGFRIVIDDQDPDTVVKDITAHYVGDTIGARRESVRSYAVREGYTVTDTQWDKRVTLGDFTGYKPNGSAK